MKSGNIAIKYWKEGEIGSIIMEYENYSDCNKDISSMTKLGYEYEEIINMKSLYDR